MKRRLKIFLILLVLTATVLYISAISTPHYFGRTVVDLDNRSFNVVSKAYISFDGTDKIVAVPEIKPLERIIVIMPENIFDKSVETTAYITYSGTTTILTGEYHSLTNDSNKNEVYFCESAIFEKNYVRAGNTYSLWEFCKEFPISFAERLKPYTRIIDLNEI